LRADHHEGGNFLAEADGSRPQIVMVAAAAITVAVIGPAPPALGIVVANGVPARVARRFGPHRLSPHWRVLAFRFRGRRLLPSGRPVRAARAATGGASTLALVATPAPWPFLGHLFLAKGRKIAVEPVDVLAEHLFDGVQVFYVGLG